MPYSVYQEEQGIPEIAAKIRRGKRDIINTILLFVVLAILYLLWTAPHYQYSAVLRINPGATQLTSETSLGSEMSIVRSWSLVKDALDSFGPPVEILIHRPPYVENLLPFANRWVPPTELTIETFDVDPRLINRSFILTAEEEDRFTLRSPEGGNSSIHVEGKHVVPGQKFTLIPRNANSYVSSLQAYLDVSYQSLNASDMMRVTFTYPNPAFAKQFLNALIDEYISQSKQRQSARAHQSAHFLRQAVENDLKQLQRKELELKILRETEGFIDLDLEEEFSLKRATELDHRLDEFRTKFEEAQNYYTPEHPTYQILLDQMMALQKQKRELEARIHRMPQQQKQLVELMREIEALDKQYKENVAKLNEEKIDIASSPGYAQIIDPPSEFPEVVLPNSKRIIVLAAMLGFILSASWVLLHDSLTFAKATSSSLLRRMLHLPVVATIPSYRTPFRKKFRIALVRDDYSEAFDRFAELARKIDFITHCADNNIISMTSGMDGQGCSFVAANLATAAAHRKLKVLLVDGNIDDPLLHEAFDLSNDVGLSNVIIGAETIDKAVRQDETSGLWILPAGEHAPNATRLLSHANFQNLMKKVATVYDVVIIDYPHDVALYHPEALEFSGSVLVVAGYNSSVILNARLIHQLQEFGINVTGTILNNAVFLPSSFLVRRLASLFSSK